MKEQLIILYFLLACTAHMAAATLHIGAGYPYASLEEAAGVALPGDILLVHNGVYRQREDIAQLRGEADAPILIIAESFGKVIYEGQSEAWHLSSCAHLYINGFVFQQQTDNGVNIDDSGLDDASAHHITIENCVFREMGAQGNNDQLKLSGLYHFNIIDCEFSDGAEGGSGIDMVGCHYGEFRRNRFSRMGSNCIQAKGGTQHILITQNRFEDGGQRALNLGGSTGLAYFRPIDAPFEAADLLVHSNVFVRGWTPIAYVGSVRVRVVNNTIYEPENWVFRILQETVDTSRFESCGDNSFSNNIIYFGNGLHRIVNVGPNTRSESFYFGHNLWYNADDPGFSGPDLPAPEFDPIIQQDPLLMDPENGLFDLAPGSPALGAGVPVDGYTLDFYNRSYRNIPVIGAFEPGGIYHDFSPPKGTEWWYEYDLGYVLYRTLERVESGGREITNLHHFVHVGDATGNFNDAAVFTTDRKTYFKNHWIPDYELLYDFNLNAGDTLFARDGQLVSVIDSVRYRYLAGQVRKVQYTHPANPWEEDQLYYGLPGELIEGIGAVHTQFEGSMAEDWIEPQGLRCFVWVNESGEWMETLHFQDVPCDSISVNSRELVDESMIFPNPASRRICFSSPLKPDSRLFLYALTGRLIRSWSAGSDLSRDCIDLDDLVPGMYCLRWSQGDRNYTSRLVIQ